MRRRQDSLPGMAHAISLPNQLLCSHAPWQAEIPHPVRRQCLQFSLSSLCSGGEAPLQASVPRTLWHNQVVFQRVAVSVVIIHSSDVSSVIYHHGCDGSSTPLHSNSLSSVPRYLDWQYQTDFWFDRRILQFTSLYRLCLHSHSLYLICLAYLWIFSILTGDFVCQEKVSLHEMGMWIRQEILCSQSPFSFYARRIRKTQNQLGGETWVSTHTLLIMKKKKNTLKKVSSLEGLQC